VITGHLGVAGLLRSTQRRKFGSTAVVALAVAALFPDVLDGVFFLFNVCSPYGLYSHTIYSVLLQSALVGGTAFLVFDSRSMGAIFAAAVLLHLPADFFTGRKLLFPGGEMVGLNFYDRPVWDFFLEAPLVVLGWTVARRSFSVQGVVGVQAVDNATHSRRLRKPTACFRSLTPEF
jgi:hypothetical protein